MHAMTFETADPSHIPKVKRPFFGQKVAQIGLLVAKLLANGVKIAREMIQHFWVRANFKTVHGGVAQTVSRFPFANHKNVTHGLEKIIQTTCDNQIHI